MTWAPVVLAALLLAAVAYPFIKPRLRSERKARLAHRGHVVHLYANYDEDLRFEPRHDRDILAVARRELAAFGYEPGDETAVVPRTFRRRVAGDERLRLWIPRDGALRPVWICEWHGIEIGGSAPAPASDSLTRHLLERVDTNPSLAPLDRFDLGDDLERLTCHELPEGPSGAAANHQEQIDQR